MATTKYDKIKTSTRTKKYNKLTDSFLKSALLSDSSLTLKERRSIKAELNRRGLPAPEPVKAAKGGDMKKKSKDDVTVISIGISTMPKSKLKKMKKGMMRGGMANGKEHMYAAGGSVSDKLPNKGLKNLAKSDKGKQAVRKMGFDV